MKAFLSDRVEREASMIALDEWGMDISNDAIYEAKRILAETEPEREFARYYITDHDEDRTMKAFLSDRFEHAEEFISFGHEQRAIDEAKRILVEAEGKDHSGFYSSPYNEAFTNWPSMKHDAFASLAEALAAFVADDVDDGLGDYPY